MIALATSSARVHFFSHFAAFAFCTAQATVAGPLPRRINEARVARDNIEDVRPVHDYPPKRVANDQTCVRRGDRWQYAQSVSPRRCQPSEEEHRKRTRAAPTRGGE